MSIRTYRVDKGRRDEIVRRVDDSWTDELRKQKGFLSYHIVATGPDELVSLTACEDERTLALVVEKSAEWVGSRLLDEEAKLLEERRGQVVSHLGS